MVALLEAFYKRYPVLEECFNMKFVKGDLLFVFSKNFP